MRIKFDKDPLAVEQNNYASKILNVYIVYDLDAWSRNSTKNFKFKNCLLRLTRVIKTVIKQSMYIVATEQYLIVQVHGVLIMTLLEML